MTTAKRCYYETLEVERTADDGQLKTAFRKLAMKWHPDRNPGDATAEVKFKEINEAYEILKDDNKRAAYDRFGHAAFEGGMGAAGARAGNPFGDFGSFGDVFEDIFGQMMGGAARSKRQNRGQDLRYNLEITLEEAARGRSAEIKVPTIVACDSCSGSGAEAGHQEPGMRHRAAQFGDLLWVSGSHYCADDSIATLAARGRRQRRREFRYSAHADLIE